MNPDEAQAWNNLGSIYLQAGKKRQAFTSFREAVKHARTNWRMWENFLFVSADLHEWQTAIRIFHKLLDLQAETDYENLGTPALTSRLGDLGHLIPSFHQRAHRAQPRRA